MSTSNYIRAVILNLISDISQFISFIINTLFAIYNCIVYFCKFSCFNQIGKNPLRRFPCSACLGAVQSDGKIHAPDSLSVYTGGRMHMLYQSNETLGAAIGQLYAKLQEQAADPMKMGAVQGQYSQFNSAQTIISNLHYNDAVQSYQKDVGGFPASVLGKLFGIQEAELFA